MIVRGSVDGGGAAEQQQLLSACLLACLPAYLPGCRSAQSTQSTQFTQFTCGVCGAAQPPKVLWGPGLCFIKSLSKGAKSGHVSLGLERGQLSLTVRAASASQSGCSLSLSLSLSLLGGVGWPTD
eukprot:COSAG01_NODE_1031_length_12014_cov_27.936131_13_plen_125_part_00